MDYLQYLQYKIFSKSLVIQYRDWNLSVIKSHYVIMIFKSGKIANNLFLDVIVS